ncbi:MAG: hypothetical protein U5Q03_18800 [Bacteroidota bacterium]|nr:hypothetical protein [Bacteroidota bacterium]
MKIRIIIFILAFLSSLVKAENVYLVKVNPGECLKCYFAQGALNKMVEYGFNVVLLFSEEQNIDQKRYISVNLPGLNKTIDTWISDSLYNKVSNDSWSELYLIDDNDSIIFQCVMKNIWKFVGKLLPGNKTVKCQFSDSIQTIFNVLKYNGNEYVVFDPRQQEIFIFAKNGDLIKRIAPEDFSTEKLLLLLDQKDSLSLNLYNKIKEALIQYGRSDPAFRRYDLKDSVLYVILSVPYPVRDNKDEISVYQKYLVLKLLIYGKEINYLTLSDNLVPDSVFLTMLDFQYDNVSSTFSFPASNTSDKDKGNYFVIKGVSEDNVLESKELLKYNLNEVFNIDTLPQYIYPHFFNEYLYFQYSNIIFNTIDENDTIFTPFKSKGYSIDKSGLKVNFDFDLDDFIVDSGRACFLYHDNELNFYYSILDLNTKEYSSPQLLDIEQKELKSNLEFLSGNSFIYINNNNEVIQYDL